MYNQLLIKELRQYKSDEYLQSKIKTIDNELQDLTILGNKILSAKDTDRINNTLELRSNFINSLMIDVAEHKRRLIKLFKELAMEISKLNQNVKCIEEYYIALTEDINEIKEDIEKLDRIAKKKSQCYIDINNAIKMKQTNNGGASICNK